MTVTFRNSGDWGAGKGSVLTSTEVDNNFWTLQQLIDDLNSTGGLVSWDSATISGNVLTFHKTDGTTSSVTIPTATPTWRGEFSAISYAVFDWFSNFGTIYQVLIAHTGEEPFDSGRQIGGLSVYQKILDFPATPVKTVTDATYSPILSDANSYIRCTNESGCAVTIPSNSEVAFPIGTELQFHDANGDTGGAGLLTLDAPTGVTLNIPAGRGGTSGTQHATLGVKKVATDEWDVFGLLQILSA